jgi:N-methylhydantoinase A/oxoprolinase/acetone carboxylase beta subunit
MLASGDSTLGSAIDTIRTETASAFSETFGIAPTDLIVTVDVRYTGQSHELEVVAGSWAELQLRFESLHLQRFGFHRSAEPIEAVNVRAAASGLAPLAWRDLPPMPTDLTPKKAGDAWLRDTLPSGFETIGPCVVVEDNSAVLLENGDRLRVLADGALEITND